MNVQQQPERAGRANKQALLAAILLIVLLFVALYTCRRLRGQQAGPPAGSRLEIPFVRPGDEIIQHTAYTLCYSEGNEQAAWVAYVSTAAKTMGPHVARTNPFMEDPFVVTGSASHMDYEGSGYDRGHLAPAEDMSWSETSMAESFYYSNMSPQLPAFNRGVWKRLEALVRYWSVAYDSIYIVTGPVLTSGLPAIGPDHVSVPEYFYKVVLRYNGQGANAIGFILPNRASAATLKSFAVPVDSVEKRTGIDFFPALPDDIEASVESKADLEAWLWTRRKE